MWQSYEGYYDLFGMVVQVQSGDQQLLLRFPGVPPGYEVVLLPGEAPHTFVMQGGPANGAPCTFELDEAGTAVKIDVAGEFEIIRCDPPEPSPISNGQGLRPPELVLTPEKREAFQELVDQMLAQADGRLLTYALPYPKHEFLQYAAMQDQFIFHGSNKADIDLFRTKRTSVEMNDSSGRGNLQAVYGTHDGLWPIFFAVIDRPNLTGSIRNGVTYFQNRQGDEIAIYNFSINQELLATRPYRPGTLYILPRDTFRRLPLASGVMSNEWASEAPVRPLARLALEPEDFPFLEQIGGHDDSMLVQAQSLKDQVITAVSHYEQASDQIRLQLNWSDDLKAIILDFIESQRQFMPTVSIALQFEPDAVWLNIAGPPAYLQVIHNQLEK